MCLSTLYSVHTVFLLQLHIVVWFEFGCQPKFLLHFGLWTNFQYLFRKPTNFFSFSTFWIFFPTLNEKGGERAIIYRKISKSVEVEYFVSKCFWVMAFRTHTHTQTRKCMHLNIHFSSVHSTFILKSFHSSEIFEWNPGTTGDSFWSNLEYIFHIVSAYV